MEKLSKSTADNFTCVWCEKDSHKQSNRRRERIVVNHICQDECNCITYPSPVTKEL